MQPNSPDPDLQHDPDSPDRDDTDTGHRPGSARRGPLAAISRAVSRVTAALRGR